MRWILSATAASAALVGAYLALGGASYAPAQPADPCVTRDWRDPGGFQEVAEQIVLRALDGAACELDVSREEIVLALSSRESFERFAREQGISDEELEELARSGLVRAIDEAEQADALNPTIADLLRGLADRVPITELLDLLDLLPGGRGVDIESPGFDRATPCSARPWRGTDDAGHARDLRPRQGDR